MMNKGRNGDFSFILYICEGWENSALRKNKNNFSIAYTPYLWYYK